MNPLALLAPVCYATRRFWRPSRLLVAQIVLGGVAQLSIPRCHAETVTYYYTNQQGTTLATANSEGDVTSVADYRPYGAQALGVAEENGAPGYTGHIHDLDSGLIYMQARYYDPVVGRFIGPDPLTRSNAQPASFGRYGYASNNPIVNTDPDGRDTCPGSTALSCIRANTYTPEKSTGQTTQFTQEAADAAVAAKGDVRTSSRPEQGGYLIKDGSTGKINLVKSGTPQKDVTHDRLVLGPVPSGAVGVLHSHVEGTAKGLQSDGDSDPLRSNLPNAAEYGGRVAAWEIVEGRLQVRMLDGKMTRDEHDDLQHDLDRQQVKWFQK